MVLYSPDDILIKIKQADRGDVDSHRILCQWTEEAAVKELVEFIISEVYAIDFDIVGCDYKDDCDEPTDRLLKMVLAAIFSGSYEEWSINDDVFGVCEVDRELKKKRWLEQFEAMVPGFAKAYAEMLDKSSYLSYYEKITISGITDTICHDEGMIKKHIEHVNVFIKSNYWPQYVSSMQKEIDELVRNNLKAFNWLMCVQKRIDEYRKSLDRPSCGYLLAESVKQKEKHSSTNKEICNANYVAETNNVPVCDDCAPRLTRSANGWVLRFFRCEGELSNIDDVTYYSFTCHEPVARDLGLEWVCGSIKIGIELSKEFLARTRGTLLNGDDKFSIIEIRFSEAVLLSRPIVIGTLILEATVRGLESITIRGSLIKAVQIAHLKDGMIYHMTAITNLKNILINGIMSKHLVESQRLLKHDISDKEVQCRRECRHETVFGKPLHDYASFYLNPRNAMLYRVSRCEGKDVVVLGVKVGAVEGKNYVVSNRNAAASGVEFGNSQAFIDGLDWEAIFSRSWSYEVRESDFRQIMQSELLVPDRVLPEWISVIFCKNSTTANIVKYLINEHKINHVLVKICRDLFFEQP